MSLEPTQVAPGVRAEAASRLPWRSIGRCTETASAGHCSPRRSGEWSSPPRPSQRGSSSWMRSTTTQRASTSTTDSAECPRASASSRTWSISPLRWAELHGSLRTSANRYPAADRCPNPAPLWGLLTAFVPILAGGSALGRTTSPGSRLEAAFAFRGTTAVAAARAVAARLFAPARPGAGRAAGRRRRRRGASGGPSRARNPPPSRSRVPCEASGVDPAAHLARLRVAHPDRSSAAGLRRLQEALVERIAYEALEIQLGRSTTVDPHRAGPPGTSADWYRARCTMSSTTRSTTSRHVSARRSGRHTRPGRPRR